MKISKNHKSIAIGLILLFAISAVIAVAPVTVAHSPAWQIPTWTYITANVNPVGINQNELLVVWLDEPPPTAHGIYGDSWTFTIEITKPDGTKQTVGPLTSDPVGSTYYSFKPDQLGQYKAVATFQQHVITGLPLNPTRTINTINGASWVNDTYLSSTSDPAYFVVQQQPITGWKETPLPTEYWMRPINDMNRDWSPLAANWLGVLSGAQNVGPTTNFNYGTAPETAHVMWATPMWTGGIMDERFGDNGYQGAHYEGVSLNPPIILDGKLFYDIQSNPKQGWYCLDLYTGKELYFHNTTGPVIGAGMTFQVNNEGVNIPYLESHGSIRGGQLTFGQIYDFETLDQHGGFPYLWSIYGPKGEANLWQMYDAYSGNYICSIANVSATGTVVNGKDGSILYYNLAGSGANRRLTVWNNTWAIRYKPAWEGHEYGLWRPFLNGVFDGRNGFSLNISIPNVQGTIRAVREGQLVIGGTEGVNNGSYIMQGNLWALNLDPTKGAIGSLLWNITFTPPKTIPDTVMVTGGATGWRAKAQLIYVDPEDSVFLFWESMTRKWYCFDLGTGKQIWESQPEAAMNFYSLNPGGLATCTNLYQGKLFSTGYGGILVAYDLKTGKVLWNYTAAQEGFESPYGSYPMGIGAIADGKIYLGSGEHSPSQPLWRGSYIRCVDANTGKELWKSPHFGIYLHGDHTGSKFAVADGYIIGLNLYDNRIYCYGKGPSATSLDASPKITTRSNGILLEGTVIDTAAGTSQTEQTARFPNGVAAMSDESVGPWMQYVYQQQSKPTNAVGVKVHLTATDPNGNYQDIGYATTDDTGFYSTTWTPPITGKYVVTATFEGSKSYYASSSKTAFAVAEGSAPIVVPTSTAAPTKTPNQPTLNPTQPNSPSPSQGITPPTGSEPTTTYIAIGAVVIIVVVAAAALVLRRRK